MNVLSSINDPKDIKKLSIQQLYALAKEIRTLIINTVSTNGGHLASNLGVVELTLALHRVFDSPNDKIVWDVGHQVYTHKIITGRKDSFHTLRKKGGISGFPKRSESIHDFVETGHATTSISAALGLLEGMRAQGIKGKVIAVIGDGALTGGMAFEALSHAGNLASDLIIVLNDNAMSIGPNVGAFSQYLSRLASGPRYQFFRNTVDSIVVNIPFLGESFLKTIRRLKKSIKALFFKENLFSELGFEYVGPIDGHNITTLSKIFTRIKNTSNPAVIHITTKKGKGFNYAENDPSRFHGIQPFCVEDGLVDIINPTSFTEVFSKTIAALGSKDNRIIAITAAMTKGTGLSDFQKLFPKRFYDVGIAEEHAVTFASGLALSGLKPIVALYSTFIQRAFDQVVHDVALPDLPVIFILDRAGAVPDDGETHQGLYDISMFSSIPNIIILAPASGIELTNSLSWALTQMHPVIIRFPKASIPQEQSACNEELIEGRGVFISKNLSKYLIISTGGVLEEVMKAQQLLQDDGVTVDVYNSRFIKPFDTHYFLKEIKDYSHIFCVEDGILRGGFGEYVSLIIKSNYPNIKVDVFGADTINYPHMTRAELLDAMGISRQAIHAKIFQYIYSKNI